MSNQFSLAAIVFVALMFLTITGANFYMQTSWVMGPAGGALEERDTTVDASDMERSTASRKSVVRPATPRS